MHVVINISLNLLIETWISTKNFHYEKNYVVIY
jgi:hypothetical protein